MLRACPLKIPRWEDLQHNLEQAALKKQLLEIEGQREEGERRLDLGRLKYEIEKDKLERELSMLRRAKKRQHEKEEAKAKTASKAAGPAPLKQFPKPEPE